MKLQESDCKNCGARIERIAGTNSWVHKRTGLPMCTKIFKFAEEKENGRC